MTVARTDTEEDQQKTVSNGGLSEGGEYDSSDPSLSTHFTVRFLWGLVSLCAAEKYSVRHIVVLVWRTDTSATRFQYHPLFQFIHIDSTICWQMGDKPASFIQSHRFKCIQSNPIEQRTRFAHRSASPLERRTGQYELACPNTWSKNQSR